MKWQMSKTEAPSKSSKFLLAIGVSSEHVERLPSLINSKSVDKSWTIVIQSSEPDLTSILNTISNCNNEFHISTATSRMKLKKNSIYINAPGEVISLVGDTLTSTKIDTSLADHSNPVDTFLLSLNARPSDRTVGILMSGISPDGINGATTLRANGVAVFVHPNTPQDTQPPFIRPSSCALGPVVPTADMAELIRNYFDFDTVEAQPESIDIVAAFQELLGCKANLDIRSYNIPLIARRILCRQKLGGHRTLDAYHSALRNDPAAIDDLCDDLLGGVTQFYRDPQAIQALRASVLDVLATKTTSAAPLRIWIPACSTGEEAYTIAIELNEAFRTAQTEGNFRIIATDINRRAIDRASTGMFHQTSVKHLCPILRDRYFTPHNGQFIAKASLRQKLIFAVQDTLTDPPYMDLDLVSCRNLLPLLSRDARSRIISLFKFGLNQYGHLFLGPTETLCDHNDDFSTVNSRWRIYQKL
jgi:two-component system CheB/CheR fusion protein